MSIPLTVESLAGGGAVERLHNAIQEALDNILDPNTPTKKARTVKLILKITPNKTRDRGDMMVETSTVLCPPAPLEASIIIDRDRKGKAVASELMEGEIPGQMSLPDIDPAGKITRIKTKEA